MVKWSIYIIIPAILFAVGCESVPAVDDKFSGSSTESQFDAYTDYAPVKIVVSPLSECVGDGEYKKINIHVSLLDRFGSQIKAPAVFRFELYEKVLRSTDPKGKRLFIWPDMDLSDPEINDRYWRDFLRSYEFNLDFESKSREKFIIEITCQCPDGQRLLAQRAL